jgi:serine/threonine protein kinase
MRALFQIPGRDSPVLEEPEKWSPMYNNFIANCLEKNPKKRPSATELLQVTYFFHSSTTIIFQEKTNFFI